MALATTVVAAAITMATSAEVKLTITPNLEPLVLRGVDSNPGIHREVDLNRL